MTNHPERDQRLGFVTAGMEFFFAVALPTAGGVLLDLYLQQLPIWTLLGLALGFAAGLYRLVRAVRSIPPPDEDDASEQ
jgi:F0F1-type ATP synthase assembly protein I